jgi:hypothetical protein
MGFDLDRLERLAGGLAILFYVLLFLAFITAVMGSGGGGLLLLVLGAVAHVGRVGLEDFVERRRELGDVAAQEGDAGERAIGLHLSWLPEIRLPRRIDLGAVRGLAAGFGAGSGGAVGDARGRVGATLATGRADVRSSLAALVAEIRERPAGTARPSFDLSYEAVEDASEPDLYDGGFEEDLVFADADAEVESSVEVDADFDAEDEFAVTDGRYEDFEVAEDDYEEIAEPRFAAEPAPRSDAPSAQERYEARQRARAERGEAEPIAVAVEAAETSRPQRVQRRQPGARPDPLRTRRRTPSF